MLRPALAALVASVIVSGCSPSLAHFPNASFLNAAPDKPLSIPAHLVRPEGAGPFPAVILLHGCHGVSASTHDWARWFGRLGYVALVVDSWKPRGIPDGCIPEAPDLPSSERFDDAVGALRFLHARPEVDRARIGVIGWSNGGVFSMAAVNGPTHERARRRGVTIPEPGFRAGIGVYPGGCFSLVQELAVRPLLVLIGDQDDWTFPGPCVEMVQAMRRRGAAAAIVLYAGAFHYFDVEGQPRVYLPEVANRNKPGECCGATVAYDPWPAADARQRVAEFFGRHLAPR